MFSWFLLAEDNGITSFTDDNVAEFFPAAMKAYQMGGLQMPAPAEQSSGEPQPEAEAQTGGMRRKRQAEVTIV